MNRTRSRVEREQKQNKSGSGTRAKVEQERKWTMFLFLAVTGWFSIIFVLTTTEVLSVPHVFWAESAGTARILIGIWLEILEHSTTQIVGNLSNLSDRILIGKVNSDRTTQNYFRPVSDRNQVVPTGSDRKDSQKSNINRSPDIRIKTKELVIQNNY